MSRIAALYAFAERFWWDTSTRRVALIVAVLTAIRLWAASATPLLYDEPYYWMWSQHLAAGYFDHPPMIALFMRAGTALFGDGVLGLRSSSFLNFIVGPFAVYAIGRLMFDHAIAIRGVLWANVTPLLGIAGFMATPDSPSAFFWVAATLAFVMVVRTGRGVWWLAVGLLAGLGVASKYTNLFFGVGIVIALLVDPRLRRWFLSPWLWAGGALALAVFMPTVLWNAAHDWVSFRFQFGRITPEAVDRRDFLTLIVVQPLIFNPLAALFLVIGLNGWLRRRGTPYRREIGLLFATVAPAIVFIVVQSTYTVVLQHWLVPTFPTLALIAVAGAMSLGDAPAPWLRRARTDVVPFAITCMLVVYAYVTTPADRWFPGKDPIDSMRGWPEFAARIGDLAESSGAGWVATAGYPVTAQLTYELRDRALVVPVNERERYTYLPDPGPDVLARPALLVVRRGTPPDVVHACFGDVTELATIDRTGTVTVIYQVTAYLARDPRPDILTTGCEIAY